MALPFTRNTNYASGSQLLSADLNDIQDVDIANIGDLIITLGGSAPSGILPTLFEQQSFDPIFTDETGISYGVRAGLASRFGALVHVLIFLQWTNSDAAKDTQGIAIVPPYEPIFTPFPVFGGQVFTSVSDFGTGTEGFPAESIIASSPGDAIEIYGSSAQLKYGDDEERNVAFSIFYRHNGVYSY
jgi:hypothetical protein